MRKNIVKIFAFLFTFSLAFNNAGMVSFAAPSVTSSYPLGGTYAQGSCGHTSTSAAATTSHGLISYKYVRLTASYRNGNSLHSAGEDDATSTSKATPQASVFISINGNNRMTGSTGYHTVQYGDLTWKGSTFEGENYSG